MGRRWWRPERRRCSAEPETNRRCATMRRMRPALLLIGACTVLPVACGAEEAAVDMTKSRSTSTQEAPAEKAAVPERGPLVRLRDSQFGPVLFDGRNRALYLFTRDPARRSRCYGDCAVAWPPFYAKGRPRAARGIDAALLGTVRRGDGRRRCWLLPRSRHAGRAGRAAGRAGAAAPCDSGRRDRDPWRHPRGTRSARPGDAGRVHRVLLESRPRDAVLLRRL